MRYVIRRSTAMASGSEWSVTQHRGKILVFIFLLSLVTTLFSLINFHNGLANSKEMGIIRLDAASRLFGINGYSEEKMRKSQMYRYLIRRHNLEIRSLKSRLVRGTLGRNGNKTVDSGSGEKVSGEENNTMMTSRDSSLVVPVSSLLINFLSTVPTKMSHKEPRGLFMEYYPCGVNTSLSLTSPLEQSNAWRGVVIYAGNDEGGGKLKSQRRFRTFVGADFQLCPPDEFRLRSKKISVHQTKKLPSPHPVSAPPLEQTPANGNKLDSSTLKSNTIIDASDHKMDASKSPIAPIVSGNKCPMEEDMPCLSLFSLTHLFKTFTIDFFAVHTSGFGEDLKLILLTLLRLRPLIQIKVISIVPRMNPTPKDNARLKSIISFMKKMNYKYQSLPLYPEAKIEAVLRGARKVDGLISNKHAVIKELYKDTVKQHLFVSNNAFINVSEHFKTYFNL
ncbi:hypothetical protein Ocin01_12833 [Orchesella cincta]|uniref:Uncharacterized protein n=1 Tax=Orchesella cincta TaxID=48709 RepID=A0A1D2MLV3_ORCCI|nr:hypothetical protein Ocin01_12833 [Orchesella cincta]